MAPKAASKSDQSGSSKPKENGATKKPAGVPKSSAPIVEETVASSGAATTSGKPDQGAYQKEQDRLKSEIDAIQKKIAAIKAQIDSSSGKGPEAERKTQLISELNEIKQQQGNVKANRSKIFDQIKLIQERIQTNGKALDALKKKHPYKSVEDVDKHIRDLEKQIESGKLTIAGEKKALNEVTVAKRARKTIEGFKTEQDVIDGDKKKIEELRATLDNPEAKAASEKYDKLQSELDAIKASGNEAYESRSKLIDQRKELFAQVDRLWTEKKEGMQTYRDANDRHFKKIQEERARRQEKYASERAAAELEKRMEVARSIREAAETPAFQAEIEDCDTIINSLQSSVKGGSSGSVPAPKLNLGAAADGISGVPKLEVRTVESKDEGLVAMKKKGQEEENYFVSSKKSKKGGAKPAAPAAGESAAATPSGAKFNVPFSILAALAQLSIPPPTSSEDVARTVRDLDTKKAWFVANQARVTKDNIRKADESIAKLDSTASKEAGSEIPAEPVPTPAGKTNGDSKSSPVPLEAVSEGLEVVSEAS